MGTPQPRPLTRVDISLDTNLTWDDSFQFGDPADQTWTLTGCNFYLSIKVDDQATSPVLLALNSLTTGDDGVHPQITVTDAINRILTMNVSPTVIRNAIVPQTYMYDLVMQTIATGALDGLMYGELQIQTGFTVVR